MTDVTGYCPDRHQHQYQGGKSPAADVPGHSHVVFRHNLRTPTTVWWPSAIRNGERSGQSALPACKGHISLGQSHRSPCNSPIPPFADQPNKQLNDQAHRDLIADNACGVHRLATVSSGSGNALGPVTSGRSSRPAPTQGPFPIHRILRQCAVDVARSRD